MVIAEALVGSVFVDVVARAFAWAAFVAAGFEGAGVLLATALVSTLGGIVASAAFAGLALAVGTTREAPLNTAAAAAAAGL